MAGASSRARVASYARAGGLRLGATFLVAWALFRGEGARVLGVAGVELAGPWEAALIEKGAPAIALACALPLLASAALIVALASLVETVRGRRVWAAFAALSSCVWAVAMSTGRKARVPTARVPFVLLVVAASVALVLWVAPWVVRRLRRRRWLAIVVGAALLVVAMGVDVRVLPRLYPWFHGALVVIEAIAVALVADGCLALDAPDVAWRRRAVEVAGVWGLFVAARSVSGALWAGPELAKYDNARRIIDERSLTFSRAEAIAMRRWPPRPIEAEPGDVDPLERDASRTLFANGRDLLLITIDALRADHLGAYGYRRDGVGSITPSLDALAAEGTVFTHAYTPTPHTSYAVTSLMTGKLMRPILALAQATGGTRTPDETLAGLLRTYGFRTAAFYPPAIFYVDADRFADLKERGLDFEYAKVEFAAPDLRAAQVGDYLDAAPTDHPLFVWVHLFEPHEPYVTHPTHDFGNGEIERYDSEIAVDDDGVGAMVRRFRSRRPNGIVIVTADHGEAFGEHGARYHGTTVYEEQSRVPLIVSAPGFIAQRVVSTPVQIVDLMPTLLSAYGIPRPPRVLHHDLGALLTTTPPTADLLGKGAAFSEVDDQTMFARGALRLLCSRRWVGCAIYDVDHDPHELTPLLNMQPTIDSMRRDMASLVASSERMEAIDGQAAAMPDALRRALAGDGTAAVDVAVLLDDVDPKIRLQAAQALARLADPTTLPELRRAIATSHEGLLTAWLAIARVRASVRLVRTAPSPTPTTRTGARSELLVEPEPADRALDIDATTALGPAGSMLSRMLALAIGERATLGDASPLSAPQRRWAFATLVAWLPSLHDVPDLAASAISVLPDLGVQDAASATPQLLAALDDVRLRAPAARTLGLLGDRGAVDALAARLAVERHLDARAPEAMALYELGDEARALREMKRILGVAEPAPGADEMLAMLCRAHAKATWLACADSTPTTRTLDAVGQRPSRLVLAPLNRASAQHVVTLAGIPGGNVEVAVGNAAIAIELGDRLAAADAPITLSIRSNGESVAVAVALLPRVDDLPPPKADRGVGAREPVDDHDAGGR